MKSLKERFSEFPINTKRLSSVLVLLILATSLLGQTREELEQRRLTILEDIENTEESLQKTATDKNKNLNLLNRLETRIGKRQELIDNINNSLEVINHQMADNDSMLTILSVRQEDIKDQYNQLLRYTYLKKVSTNTWSYILSSKSLNDAFIRWRYSKQFEKYCKEKSQELTELQEDINERNEFLVESRKQQLSLADQETSQMGILAKEKQEQAKLVKALSTEESKLKKELDKKKKERERLNNAIEAIILKELSEKSNRSIAESAASLTLSESFSENRGKLPWPVTQAKVKSPFGVQPHPTIRGLKIDNNGVDLMASTTGAEITAIYNGKVIGVTSIPGYDNMIIVQHGDFYTVYSKIASVYVSKDQEIKTGQLIGKLKDDNKEVHIELWKNKSKMDPLKWLRKS
ncbi:MAG: peptidoglycan DD-metalloendopeptidase family protein [Saprospiraceae bacterium]|nr:peptidoglycan DD-metalloendopeptidase family protein [Saprospiraceae bacterium]